MGAEKPSGGGCEVVDECYAYPNDGVGWCWKSQETSVLPFVEVEFCQSIGGECGNEECYKG